MLLLVVHRMWITYKFGMSGSAKLGSNLESLQFLLVNSLSCSKWRYFSTYRVESSPGYPIWIMVMGSKLPRPQCAVDEEGPGGTQSGKPEMCGPTGRACPYAFRPPPSFRHTSHTPTPASVPTNLRSLPVRQPWCPQSLGRGQARPSRRTCHM